MEDDRPKPLMFFACFDAYIVLKCALDSPANSGQQYRAIGKTSQSLFKKTDFLHLSRLKFFMILAEIPCWVDPTFDTSEGFSLESTQAL